MFLLGNRCQCDPVGPRTYNPPEPPGAEGLPGRPIPVQFIRLAATYENLC